MGGDHRPDAQSGKERLDFLRRDIVARGVGQHMVEAAAERSAPARPLDRAAPAHGGVLLGNRKKLEPDALRLECPRHQLRREALDVGAARQDRFDLRLMPAHHLDEELKQEIGRPLGGRAADHGLRRRELAGGWFQLLIHGYAKHSYPRDRLDMGPPALKPTHTSLRRRKPSQGAAPSRQPQRSAVGPSTALRVTRSHGAPGAWQARPPPSSRTRSDWAQP